MAHLGHFAYVEAIVFLSLSCAVRQWLSGCKKKFFRNFFKIFFCIRKATDAQHSLGLGNQWLQSMQNGLNEQNGLNIVFFNENFMFGNKKTNLLQKNISVTKKNISVTKKIFLLQEKIFATFWVQEKLDRWLVFLPRSDESQEFKFQKS